MRRIAALLFTLAAGRALAASDLSGRVVDAAGKAIPNAHVYVYTAHPKTGPSAICPSCYRDCGKHEAAGGNGEFRIASLDDTLVFTILAVAPGFRPVYAKSVDAGRGPVTITLTERPADSDVIIRGVVLDPEGKPVVGAAVEPRGYRIGNRIGYGNLPGVDNLSITDQTGAFALRIPDCEARLDVVVHARNFAPKIARDFRPWESRPIVLGVGSTIHGRAMRDGRPAPGVRIAFVQRNRASGDFLGTEEIATNEDGVFVMTWLGPNVEYVVGPALSRSPWPDQQRSHQVTTGAEGSLVDAGVIELK